MNKDFKLYTHKGLAVHLFIIEEGDKISRGVLVMPEDKAEGSPKVGDAVVRNLRNFNDIKLVPKAVFEKEYTEGYTKPGKKEDKDAPKKLSVDHRIGAIQGAETIETLNSLMEGERSKRVKDAAEKRIGELSFSPED